MGDAMGGRYWCHMCSQMVNPILRIELKCPHCDSGFVEELDVRGDIDDQTLSLWGPILFGMLGGGSLRGRRVHREQERGVPDQDRDREVEALRRRQRRASAILHLLQALRQGNRPESDTTSADSERRRRRDHVILINPFSQAIILQGSSDPEQREAPGSNRDGIPVGNYFLGNSLDDLLQRLADNYPNRYGTPPAMKEAVDAMPTVKIEKSTTSCSICLEEFEVGGEARETPCKHSFHGKCILPWLELHSSCPVCRFQMPADESKVAHGGGGGDRSSEIVHGEVPWTFDLLHMSGPQSSGGAAAPPSSSRSGSGNSQPNEN